jgi:hypothetical protein
METIVEKRVSNASEAVMYTWNKDSYYKLKEVYNFALKAGEESFMFDDLAFNTKYAGYLLLYLGDKLGIKKNEKIDITGRSSERTRSK